jgi:hypothetical protein
MYKCLFAALLIATYLGGNSSTAFADFIVIDSVLGIRSKEIPGIEAMSQADVAKEAAQLAFSEEGWNLENLGGGLQILGPPYWSGGIEWTVNNVPSENSNDWGYELNEEAEQHGGARALVFHTDDTISRMQHDICEPSPFGVISGTMAGAWSQCAVTNWGIFYVCMNPYIVLPDGSGDYPSIQSALDAMLDLCNVIILTDGVYSGSGNCDLNFHGKSLILRSQSGNPDSCIIDCQGTESEPHRGFLFQSGETSDAIIEGITIANGYADEGGAIKCENGSSPTVRNCILRDNYATSGAALFSENSSPAFENCTISFNASPTAGAAFLVYSDPIFENCILSHSTESAAVFGYESNPLLACTDVVWNEGGDWVGCIADQQNQNGNFSNTPAFCEPESGDFRLQPGSPCLPEHNSCGVQVGALGEGDCSPTGAEEVPGSARVSLAAFPNPFNPHLTITFSLPTETQGSLIVHDVSGRHVRVLKDGQFAQGQSEIIWNGQDDHGREVASGVYFVRLLTGEYQESKKVVLLR